LGRLIFDADTLGGTTTLSSADAVGNFTITVPAVTGTMSVKDASDDATFRNITLTGAVLAGAWNGTRIGVPYGGTGAVTLTGYVKGNGTSAMTASSTIPNTDITGLGTMSTQGSDAVTITGGTANGLTIGASNPAAGTFTTLRFNSTLSANGSTGTSGQVLTSNGASAPTWQNIAGSGTVTSIDVSGGTTGLTTSGGPVTGAGTITLAGTLAEVNGGTGQSSYVVGNLLYASTTTALSKLAIGTTGQVLTVAAGVPSWATPTTGTVTSVAALTLGTSGTDLSSTVANGTTTPVITLNVPTASASNRGVLSAADWTTFNSKGSVTSVAGTGTVNGLTLTGTVTSSGSLTLGGTLSLVSPPPIGTTTPAEVKATTGWAANLTLTDAATIAWDTATSQVATFTFVSSNRTMGAPTNLKNGAFYALAVIQNGGSNTLTWNSVFKWAAGTAPTLSTAAGAKDYFTFRSDGTNLYQQGISQAVA